MTPVYSIDVMNDLRQIKSRSDPAYRLALRALRRLEQLGPAPDGHVKRVLPQFAPQTFCQLVFPRGGRTILVRYKIEGGGFTVLNVVARASPRW